MDDRDRALALAVSRGQADLVDRLLEAGADLDRAGLVGTPLMGAAMNGDLAMVRRLLEAGADLNRVVKRETALSAAMSENQQAVVEYLEGCGALCPPDAKRRIALAATSPWPLWLSCPVTCGWPLGMLGCSTLSPVRSVACRPRWFNPIEGFRLRAA